MSEDEDLKDGELSVVRIEADRYVMLGFRGKITAREPGKILMPYLLKVMRSSSDKRIVLDFRQLTFMNSSSLKTTIEFASAASQAGRSLEIRYNRAVTWQRQNHDTLGILFKRLPGATVSYATP